jgi:plastocyanin
VDGRQYVAIATGGNMMTRSAYGDAVWAFALNGKLDPLWPPPPPATVAGPIGPIVAADKVKIAEGNVEYAFVPSRIRIKAGTAVTFTNVGDLPHSATAFPKGTWDTGLLAKGQSKQITFTKPGKYYYICMPHPWMYGEVIVEK